MSKLLYAFILITFINFNPALAEKIYEVPPSDSTYSSVPYISDEAMEKCVILYNESKWLANEIDATQVDRYSQASIDAYNEKITRYTNMENAFNRNCAGKQSESAYRAAQELNQKNKASK